MKKQIWPCLLAIILGIFICAASAAEPSRSSGGDANILPVPQTELSPLPGIFPKIDRHPNPSSWMYYEFLAFLQPIMDWPPEDIIPNESNWKQIMEYGKDPGLGVRGLHAKGISGRGVGIAIIDSPLLVDHREYANQLRLYEETDDIKGGWMDAQMHGPAVASIAVGKTVGVAPDADLYYIATALGGGHSVETCDFSYRARSIRHILEINKQLPKDRKIRAISMSIGWMPNSKGYSDIAAAAKEAKDAGMLVICSSVEEVHGFKFHALGRPPLADPQKFESYTAGLFWAKEFFGSEWSRQWFKGRLMIPMDSRTVASPTDPNLYIFYRKGGWSWSIPYIAGVYALAAQVDPTITSDKFWSLAERTGKTIDLKHNSDTFPLGPIIDPVGLVASLQAK